MQKKGERLPFLLSRDLICLELGHYELSLILNSCDVVDKLAFEIFLMEGIQNWGQNLASSALRTWVAATDRLLWFATLPLFKSPLATQRMQYTLVDISLSVGGRFFVEKVLVGDGWEEYSPAFHGLLLNRAQQFHVNSPRLDTLARRRLTEILKSPASDNKAFLASLSWLAEKDTDFLTKLIVEKELTEIWKDLIKLTLGQIRDAKSRLTLVQKSLEDNGVSLEDLKSIWPPLWLKHRLSSANTYLLLKRLTHSALTHEDAREFLTGIPAETLIRASLKLSEEEFTTILPLLQPFIPPSTAPEFEKKLRSLATAEPSELSSQIEAERKAFLEHDAQHLSTAFIRQYFEKSPMLTPLSEETSARSRFFDLACRNKKTSPDRGDNFWSLLTQSWHSRDKELLDRLSKEARQMPLLFVPCYIKALGHYKGDDAAVLKILDYVRSENSLVMSEIISALASIGTQRALSELVQCLSRPNSTPQLKLDICAHLSKADVGLLQPEIRNAIKDLETPENEGSIWELKESLYNLLRLSPPDPQGEWKGKSKLQLDEQLKKKFSAYPNLSGEIKRSLRTAVFFHSQSVAQTGIDLTPVIDMQYKSLELLFRENFEEFCGKVIKQGLIQRKLDIIGYARPVPEAMQEFENYIASLPNVRNIPFFSRFKMRKLLRSLCLFRPGRRFTLDGIKAFAIFFLCFSRKQCRYGLANLAPLNFTTDEELTSFCKKLHIFQDIRNRAAHEGFRADQENDIESIWENTTSIFETVQKLRS